MKTVCFFAGMFLWLMVPSVCFPEQLRPDRFGGEMHTAVQDYGQGQVYLVKHTVERGEHLLKILRKNYRVALEDLGFFCRITADINPEIEDIEHLYVGQVILVPYKFEDRSGYAAAGPDVYDAGDKPVQETEQRDVPEPERDMPEGIISEEEPLKQVDAGEDRSGYAAAGPDVYDAGDKPVQETEQRVVPEPERDTPEGIISEEEPLKQDHVEHRVKQGEYYSRILRDYGLPDRKIFSARTRRAVKQANPDIEDINRLTVGQILKIPVSVVDLSEEVRPAPEAPLIPIQRIEPAKPDITEVVIKPRTAEDNFKTTVSSVVDFFQGSGKTFDGTEIPLSGRGMLRIDFSKFPLYELPWGRRFVVDYGNRLPAGISAMFADGWKHTDIVSVGQTDDIEMILDRVFDACGFFKVEKQASFTVNRNNIQISVNGRWVIFKDEFLREVYIFNIVKEDSSPIPPGIRQYFSNMGVTILDIRNGVIQEAKGTGSSEDNIQIKKVAADPKSLTDGILSFVQSDYRRNYSIQVMQSLHKGFSLEFVADRAFKKDGQWHVIDFNGLPQEIEGIANGQGIKVVAIDMSLDPVQVIEEVLDFCGAEYMMPPARISGPSLSITLPGFLAKTPDGDVIITRQSFEEDFARVISELGVSILQF